MPTDTVIFQNTELNAFQSSLKRLGLAASEDVLIADLGEKILFHTRKSILLKSYPVSCSARPRSCKVDSLGTPWGLHEICARHGGGEPAGMVFSARQPTGSCWQDLPDAGSTQKCLVTTRIMRLRGLDPGINSGPGIDSHERYIYIHGTNHPKRFPENISGGCILMRDDDLIELFDKVRNGTLIWLSPPMGG